jgi:hypothetical protein
MKEVTLPDGKVIKIPDNLDPAKRSELASAVSRQYDGFNIDEPTLGGRVAEFGKAIPREGLSGLANIIKGPVALFDIGNDSAAYKYLEEQDRVLREDSFLAPEAGYEDLYSTKIGGAFGSVIPYLGAGLLGGAIGKAANLSQTTTRYGLPIALAGSPGGIGQGADLMAISRELGEEISPIQEITAEILNATIGASEVFPIANILKKVPKKALKDLPTRELILEYMKSAAQAATYEGAQEVGASLARNLVARGLYSDELPIVDSVFEEFTLGGIVGGTLDLVFNSMQKRRGIATHEEGERAERAKVDSNKLINAKKAELAEQQGVLPVIQDQPFKLAPSIPTPVELEVAPDLQIIENTDSTFSLLDQNNLENPVIKTVPTQAEALVENKKIKDTFAQKQIQQQLDNDLYSLGLINSSTAYRIGESLLNPNSVSVGINTIIKYDPKAKNKTLKKYREELETAGTYNKLPFQNQYTIADAQKLLSKSEFNNFASDAAAKIFETSEKNGTPSIRDGKQTIDTSRKYIKDFAAGKNIDLDFNTPAVNYAAKLYTGEGNYSKMSKGQKELFLAKIHSLPNFNVKTPFPNFAPRAYSAKDTADFVATIGSTEFVGRDVQNFLKDREISTLAASDFLSDLDKSGRAQFVKGKEKGFLTSVRQIKPNFEFDIARRAEGFNETPEEFRTRLESQGELKAEVIEQMVQNETARQEPYTPPKQLEEQTINFAEAMEEGRTNKFAKELRKILNTRGLKDTSVIVSNDILSTRTLKEQDGQIAFDPREVRQAEGEYDKNTDIIFLSLNAVNPDGNATDAEIQTRLNKILDHEMIHALRAKDLITENEYRYLKNLVKNRRVPKLVDAQAFEQKETFYTRSKRINAGIENYGASANKVEEIYIEEAIAELFRTREVVAQDVPPKAKGIYNKIVQFFQGVGNAMKISGYNKAADIFQDIEAGKVGTRTRGEIRTLRDLDQAGRGQARVVTDYEDDRETPTGPVIETNLKPSTIRPLAFDPRATPTTTPTTPTTPVTPTTPTTPVTPVTPIATPTVTPSVPTTIFDARKISNKEYIQQRKNILLGLQEAGVIDKRIFDANGKVIDTKKGNNDSVKMLKWLIDNSPSEDYKIIAQKTYQSLLSLKKIGYKFPFKIVNEESSFRGRITPLQADGKTRASDQKRTAVLSMTIADPNANYLFNKDRWRSSNGVNFETLLHENIHQATVAQMFATRDGNATGDAQSFARIEKAFEELQSQQKRLKKHYDDRIKYYKNASKQLNNPKVQEEISKKLFDLVVNNPIEAEIAQIFIKENSDAPYTYIQQDTYLSEINLKAFRDFEIGYQLFGKRKQTNRDVSEMLTFGLTNRSFQKMLESIPYKNNKTLWQGFVESVRKILGIPAKLDTELSAFLSNAAEVLDAQAIGLEPINPRAPPKTKETDQSSYGTMPTKAVITSPFKQDTSIPEKPWRGKINGFEVELQRNPDASGGESVWSAYLPPRTQEVNGVMLSGDGGLDLRNNRKESTEFLLDQWQSMLNRGYTINPYNGFAQWQMKKVITLEDSRQDVPTFSRISKRGELDNRIADLDRRIEIKENTLRQDSQYLGTASYNRMSNEIDVLKGQRARLVEERNNLPPEQIPLFSRAATDTSPAYADFFEIFEDYSRGMETNDHFNVLLDTSEISWQERSEYRDGNTSNYFARYIKAKEESAESGQLVSFDGRDDIVLELETREKYNLETFPRVFVMRMPINDFIKLTTPDDLFIEEQITPYIKDNKFDPLEFGYSGDTPFSFPVLAIDSKGQVTGHDGRGRSLTALQDGATEVPVILFIERGKDDNLQENYKFMGDQIDDFTPMTLGIGALFPQKYQGINNRPETFGKTQFRKDYFFDLSRFKDYDIAPLNPLYSITGRDTQNRRKNQMEANKQTVNMINPPIDSSQDVPLFSRADLTPRQSEMPTLNREDFSSFRNEVEGKIYPDGIFNQLEGSRLGGTREKPGALKVAITNGLKNKKIQEASKNFLQQFTNSRGNLILFRSLNIPENENIKNYGQLPEDDFASTTLNPREAQAIGRNLFNRAYNLGGTWNTEILRYEVPMDKVIGYVPTLIQAMRSNYLDTYKSDLAGSGYRSREEIEEEQAEMDEAGDFYFQEEQSMEELLDDENYKLDEYINEAEVVADLRGIKPTYQYSPKTRAREEASITRNIPLFSRASRNFSDGNSNESIKRREAVKVAEERTKETPRGEIPFYNLNASDIALEAAIEFNQDPLKTAPNDIPTFSKAMPSNLQEAANTVGVATPKQSLATRMIDFASNPIASIKKQFKDFRTNYIDNFDAVDKRIIKGSEENDEVRRANNTADTAVMAAIRLADRARGIFQQMLLKGFPVDQIEGMPSLTKVVDLEISTRYNPLIEGDTSTGGLMQILSALQSDPEVDLEGVFSLYAKLKRVKKLNDKGIEIASPIGSKELQAIETIEREHPVVVETYNNYQKWNNGLVKFATKKGLLDADQAAKWIEHSSYYPFYRTMVDDGNMTAPTIAGGSLPNNPLNMPMKGSEEKIDVDPIEAIARNSLSILTAAMKNDGTMKLIRDLEKLNNPEKNIKEATLITDKNKLAGINSVFVFENGNKKHYKIADIDIFMAMQSIGGVKSDGLMKILAVPAGLLRDTVTRDPGFVFVNVFRDTISAAVTSGAPLGGEGFTPIIDSFKNLFGDISSLEEFGVIGGYDFANDEGDIKDFLNRARRRAGLSPNNGLRADVAFYKLWDGLGHLTTKSDGATRKAVADAVYKKLIKEGYTEAQAQSEAAYQGLEIINFGRRGQSSMFKILTTAIPFLNARVQGLDVLYRSFSGQYSAQDKLQEGGSLEDLQGMIMRRALMRLAVMIGTTAMYYALVSDTDEYKAEKLEKRDDNYIIPIGGGNVIYLPIAFEVGMLTKAIPERLFDLISGKDAFSDTSITDFKESTVRQLSNSLNLPFLGGDIGIQAFKPIFEAVTNRASFTNSEIVPYFMAKEKPAYQSRKSTNEIFRLMGETLNISPIKLEYIFKGYTGTLGGYALTVTDALARSVTGTPLMPMNIKQIPVVGRFVGDQEKMGGYQQQFYKLREEVNTAVTTMNSLREDGRMDELYAYRNQVQGLLNAKGQVRALERYMSNWRKRRDRIINRTDINASVRSEMLLDLEIDRDKRLAMIPELRQKANIPPDTVGVLLR